jgi:PAS domain S-box-containing protein
MAFWTRLVEPASSVEDPGDRRTARLLATLLVVLVPLGLASAVLQLVFVPGFLPIFVAILVALAFLAVAYVLSRGPHHRAGAIVTTVVVTLASLASALAGPRPDVSLSFLLLGPLLASFLLTTWETLAVAILGAAGGALDAALGLHLSAADFAGPLSFHVVASALILVGRRHRDQVEADRRSKLAESEARSRMLVEATFDAMLLARGGTLIAASAGCERVFGMAPTQLIGRNVRELFDEAEELAPVLTSERGRVEALGIRGAGRFPAELVFRSTAPGGDAIRAIAVRDVTDQRLVEARLRLQDRLVSLGTLTAGVAHELNNPLAYAGLNIELARRLVRDAATADLVDALLRVQEGVDRMTEIVRGLKTFARGDEDKVGPVDIAEVLRSTLRMIGPKLEGVRIVADLASRVPPASVNAARIGQVFTNLLLNAAAATAGKEDAELRVTLAADDAMVRVTIAYNGAGIPAELVERIFDPFFTTKPVGEGTGLGLAICHGIVTAMRGEIRVESVVDRGTTFEVSLPIVGRESAAA